MTEPQPLVDRVRWFAAGVMVCAVTTFACAPKVGSAAATAELVHRLPT
jgi:hypothetical protein